MLIDKKISANQIQEMQSPLEQDLWAFFQVAKTATIEQLSEARKAGKTPEQAIEEIKILFDKEAIAPVTKALNFKAVKKAAYKLQGRLIFQGLPISIENRKGSVRSGVDADGHQWRIKMKMPYGYIRLTEGTDGDHVDCYVGENKESKRVYIIHQNHPDTGKYDEDKVMLGYNSAKEAKEAYLQQYDRPGFFGSMTTCNIDQFKEMLEKKKGKKLTTKK